MVAPPPDPPAIDPERPRPDPILVRRARWARLATAGRRVGFLLLLIAIVAFAMGLTAGFPPWAATVSITGLIAAWVVLPPAIIAGYAVRAAAREDRRTGRPDRLQ